VTPEAIETEYPTLLEMPSPLIFAYPREQELHDYLDRIPTEKQRRVVEFARTLAEFPVGHDAVADDLDRFAGSIDATDLALMSQAIEEGCEQVNSDDWR
jgi:hypothetical protein